jgi:hypothetical protein
LWRLLWGRLVVLLLLLRGLIVLLLRGLIVLLLRGLIVLLLRGLIVLLRGLIVLLLGRRGLVRDMSKAWSSLGVSLWRVPLVLPYPRRSSTEGRLRELGLSRNRYGRRMSLSGFQYMVMDIGGL